MAARQRGDSSSSSRRRPAATTAAATTLLLAAASAVQLAGAFVLPKAPAARPLAHHTGRRSRAMRMSAAAPIEQVSPRRGCGGGRGGWIG